MKRKDQSKMNLCFPKTSMALAFLAICILCSTQKAQAQVRSESNSRKSFQVGVILDLDSPRGRIGWSCLSIALSDFYSVYSNYTTRLLLHPRDSKEQVIEAVASGLILLRDVKVDAIIGPQKSSQANFLIHLGDRAHVPIISFTATSPSLRPQTPYFVQTIQSDDEQVGAIAAIVKAFAWSQVVIIYEDSDYGTGIVPSLSNAFQDINARVSYKCVIPLSASDELILIELYKMMTMQTRVFVVHLSHSLAARLFLRAKEIGMMSSGYAWIVTSVLMDLLDSLDFHLLEAMQGVLGVKPLVPNSQSLESFTNKWKRQNQTEQLAAEPSILGLLAYDTLWALAMAVERVSGIITEEKGNGTNSNSGEDPFTLDISQTGPQLLKAILDTRFEGLSGKFQLINGQRAPPSYQILNVVGDGEREIGIWTPARGLVWQLNSTGSHSTSSKDNNFKSIIWPGGDSRNAPKGWEVPVRGKKLRIGVPVKSGFFNFVRVTKDQTNSTRVGGYYIDIFNAVMAALPYAVPYEYVPFEKPDGSSAGTYNDLVYQVFLQNYDGAVGDITITANRSRYVDFTLPFAEGGIVSVVPITYEDMNDKWAFLKPLGKDLWVTSIAIFIYTGFAVWVLEHRVNPAFRGTPSQRVGKIFYFTFMTLVFAHREKILNNLTRLVLVVWMFVVLILSSTYTASLSSRLTVQRLQPAITDVKDLIRNGDYVGCQEGSFIIDFLKDMGFEESKIRPCKSPESCDEALSNGSKNGGISAFFDVVPYVKHFLSKYCKKYMIFGPTYRTDGFAHVFPMGSPLVADISRAVIELTEKGKILEIEQQWFKFRDPECSTPQGATSSTNSVPLRSFQGLFVFSGAVTAACLLVSLFFYISTNEDFLQTISVSLVSITSRVFAIWSVIRDQTSAHFGKSSSHLQQTQHSSPTTPSSSPEMHSDAVAVHPISEHAADAEQPI